MNRKITAFAISHDNLNLVYGTINPFEGHVVLKVWTVEGSPWAATQFSAFGCCVSLNSIAQRVCILLILKPIPGMFFGSQGP